MKQFRRQRHCAAKPANLNPVPGIHMVEGREPTPMSCSLTPHKHRGHTFMYSHEHSLSDELFLAFGRQRQAEFEASLVYVVRHNLKKLFQNKSHNYCVPPNSLLGCPLSYYSRTRAFYMEARLLLRALSPASPLLFEKSSY